MIFEAVLLAIGMMVVMTYVIIWVLDRHLTNLAMPYREHALRVWGEQRGGGGGGGDASTATKLEAQMEEDDAKQAEALKNEGVGAEGGESGKGAVEMGEIDMDGVDDWTDKYMVDNGYLLGDPISDVWGGKWGLAEGSESIVQLPHSFGAVA